MNTTLTSNTHTVVIGAGFAGIATALRLRAIGHDVTVIERLDQIGGRARTFNKGGYKHDAGPTVITAPFLFRELFQLFDENFDKHIELIHLDPYYRFYFSETREEFDYRADVKATQTEIARFSKEDAESYNDLLAASHAIYNVGFKKLVHRPFNKLSLMVAQIPALIKLKCYQTVWQMVSSYLKHPLIRKAFTIHPLLIGGNPFKTTAIYSLIHYLERKWGVFFCKGGTSKLVFEFEQLMLRQGIRILKNADVLQINHNKKQAYSLTLASSEIIKADNFVYAGDPETCYKELLNERGVASFYHSKMKYSMGLYVLYFGTKKNYNKVAHHTIWMGQKYKSLLRDIFDKKILNNDFSLYLHRPTATDKSFAPDNCDSFYVLCPVPNLQGNHNWDIEGKHLSESIIKALEETILPELSSVIESVFWMTPDDFKKDYRSMHGAGFSIEPTLTQSAWFRHHNRHKHIKNLYFAGAGTHPGAGLPGVVSSAKVVQELITGQEVGSGDP